MAGDTAARVRVELAALPAHVRTARIITAAVARRAGLPDARIDELRFAVGEACTRAVDLHARVAPQEAVVIDVSWGDGALRVDVSDRGPRPEGDVLAAAGQVLERLELSAGPLAAGDPDPAEPDLGLALLRGLVDDLAVSDRAGGGTTVTLRWPLSA